MARPRRKELIRAEFFEWRVGILSNGVYQADGRSNKTNVGRHSLGTKNRDKALTHLKELDRQLAIEFGLAPADLPITNTPSPLSFEDGAKLYLAFVGRPAVAGGARPTTSKRYRPVFEKFGKVMKERGIRCWQQVGSAELDAYAAWLDDNEYEYASQYLELTTIKQCLNWLVKNKHLPASCLFDYPMKKAEVSATYCYTVVEVTAMIEHCYANPDLRWLGEVIVGLAHTGLRISELAALRWTDLDFENGIIRLPDRSRVGTREEREKARTTKGRRERVMPIHKSLRNLLENMKRHADGRVFHGLNGGIVRPDKVRNVLIRDVLTPLSARFPSLPGETGFCDGRVHSFRHFFCSVCANSGVPELMLMDWLGHRHSLMVKRYYHASREEARKQLNAIEFTDPKAAPTTSGTAGTSPTAEPGPVPAGADDEKSNTSSDSAAA